MKAIACVPYLLTYCWCELASLPLQQYGSVESQYDWMMAGLAGEHWKPLARAANCSLRRQSESVRAADKRKTYTLGLASADIVGEASNVVGVAHEDSGLDGGEGSTGEGSAGTTAERVVHDLTTLRVANKDNLGVGAALVEVGDRGNHGRSPLRRRRFVGRAATRRLATTGRVADGIACSAGVCLLHHVDEALRGAVAGRRRGLTGTKDVHTGARLPSLNVDGAGTGKAGENRNGDGGNLHVGSWLESVGRIV